MVKPKLLRLLNCGYLTPFFFKYCSFICNLDIFPLISMSDIFSINEPTDKYMLSGCELIDTKNISLPSQNMKFGGE